MDGQHVYWIEQRPQQGGSYQLCHWLAGAQEPIETNAYSVRSTVYNYGGGALAVAQGQRCFVHCGTDGQQQLYQQTADQAVTLLAEHRDRSYGDLQLDLPRQRVMLVEQQTVPDADATLQIKSYSLLADKPAITLAQGDDYYSSPALQPGGHTLAYLCWQQPDMPWDNNELWWVNLDDSGAPIASSRRRICGDCTAELEAGESIVQPRWSPDGRFLFFISDRSNWWSLYCYDPATEEQTLVAAIDQAEMSTAQWELGMSSYDFLADGRIALSFYRRGEAKLAIIDTMAGAIEEHSLCLDQGPAITAIGHLHAQNDSIVFVGAGPQVSAALLRYHPNSRRVTPLIGGDELEPVTGTALPQTISFPVAEDGLAHGFYYPPHNATSRGVAGERIPLLIKSHGGPTTATSSALDWSIQYFTSRGFAVLDINYRGSSGYGRQYRHALYGQWGIADREDCLAAIEYLATEHRIDPRRVIARGTSAGGYLTLVLATFTQCLRAGASYAGISDLKSLYQGTHKFEKYYLKRLLDPQLDCADERSPLFSLNSLDTPLFFAQGLQDKVVPAEQTQQLVEAMKARGVPVEAYYYPDEQHGLRRGDNIAEALTHELAFFLRQLGLAHNGAPEPPT